MDENLRDDDENGADGPLRLVSPLKGRLDKALAAAGAPFSRSRLATLISTGAVTDAAGAPVREPARKTREGETFLLTPPPPAPVDIAAEAIPLDVVHEDSDLIVVDKPAGMVAHPAPGAWTGTLVSALLHHCGESLSGVGGVARPGIVHRIDKDTSGLLVVAKSDAAHRGLAEQFAAHSVERVYSALLWGAPDRSDPRLAGHPAVSFEGPTLRIEAPIGRHPADRKKMAVIAGGRRAVTRATPLRRVGPTTLAECRLETGRTHQIRVHLAHIGHPLVGDPVYGRARKGNAAAEAFPRQALHAGVLGFVHPSTGEEMRFERPPPADFLCLLNEIDAIIGG